METFEQKVRNILRLQFKGEGIQFHHDPGERIYGFIISEKFEGLDFLTRHEMIWSVLRSHLTPEEQQQIIGFLEYTPAEEKFYSEAYEESE
jgi:acid stress-induced BolA-like protein IbaG/YrbA